MVIASTNSPNLASDATKTRFTPDEYRAIEETAEERHEYCNGEIIAIPGGSPAHSRITVDITTFLNVAVRDTNFQIYNGDLRIWIPSFNHGTYPDVLVIDGEPEFNGDRTDEILNPLLIVEVLSPSTEAYDRGEKFRKYRSLSSFCEYLLVSQTEPYIEQYHNLDSQNNDGWQWQVYDGIDRAIVLQSLNIELPMSEVYRRINF
ncbi:Uma2 family endonuclease [Tychonema sp. LEGE 07203]|uniref:Uma2 family endonuclease n=1 Tax=Tychonema sp. LEGE 07203 TaxID=1828671 RepID=UPI001881152C|nr:Uma2 family endonuclease [Tychonema sp. LEGE 07203]